MLDTFVRQFDDLTPQQRVVMLRRVHETSSQLIGQVLAIAKNFGDNEELVAELKPVLRAKNWEKADGTTDYGAYIACVGGALDILQAYEHRAGFLLAEAPIPPNFAQDIIENVIEELDERIQEESRTMLAAKVSIMRRQHAEREAATLAEIDEFGADDTDDDETDDEFDGGDADA